MTVINYLISFAERWLGPLSNVMLTFFAVLFFVVTLGLLWEFRGRIWDVKVGRTVRGVEVAVPLVIVFAALSVLTVGLMTPQVMVGDEVTHYYMLTKQSQDLSQPNFFAEIPTGNGGIEVRRYPHSFLWHYLGAVVYHFTGGSFASVQIYQTLFLIQLLSVGYLLARSRGGVHSGSALMYVLSLASLPLCLIFSVTFYQDVPMAAQALTAFYLLSRNRWVRASLFMAFAIGLKVTAVLFFPAFFGLLLFSVCKHKIWKRGIVVFICSLLIVLGSTWMLGKAINIYGHAEFYPQEKLERLVSEIKNRLNHRQVKKPDAEILQQGSNVQSKKEHFIEKHQPVKKLDSAKLLKTTPDIIANHPGDLRIKENYLIYGGVIMWILFFAGCVLYLPLFRQNFVSQESGSALWLWIVGVSYLSLTAFFTKTAPDARFFLPGLPFILLPIVEKVVRLPKPKLLITLLAALAIVQGGYVLAKTYRLRVVTSEIQEAIKYLVENPPTPKKIFMYPEGNYRLFSVQHEWYLGYRLREFWWAGNDKRIKMLNEFGIGAIVVKKHLVSQVDEEITNLGVYPVGFINDLENDKRFSRIFDNKDISIYSVRRSEM